MTTTLHYRIGEDSMVNKLKFKVVYVQGKYHKIVGRFRTLKGAQRMVDTEYEYASDPRWEDGGRLIIRKIR